jgi:hypothetical protein
LGKEILMDFVPVNSIKRIAIEQDGEVTPERMMRMGVFSIRRHVIEKFPQIMQKIFECFVPMEIENSFVRDIILYTGYSPDFEETPEGSFINEYEVVFNQSLSGIITIRFDKIREDQQTSSARKVTFF